MAEDSDLERTESATGRRIQRARDDGKVVQSRELSTFIELMAALLGLMLLGGSYLDKLLSMMREGFSIDHETAFNSSLMLARFSHASMDIFLAFLPLLALMIAATLAGPLLLAGWNFTWKPLTPDIAKFNPLTGLKRIVSLNGLVELLKSTLKATLIGGIAVWVVWHNKDDLFALASESLGASLSHLTHLLLTTSLFIVSSLLLLVLADVPYQLWQYAKNLRMTKEEVKQEAKEMEGDPQIKARIRAAQRAASRKRMMAAVPKADVIVTNPDHYAVALQYEEGQLGAPQVVAKGSGLLAQRIVELGREHSVPLLQAPPLARALYRHADVGDEIPQRLYTAVAEVLAYVFQLRSAKNGVQPKAPTELPVPQDMDIPEMART